MTSSKIVFLGAGSMAEALISGLLNAYLFIPSQIYITNHKNDQRLHELHATYGVIPTRNYKELLDDATILFLAMKPKDVENALQKAAPYIKKETVIISMLAGVSIESIQNLLNHSQSIIRTMPNTSAAISKAATALTPNSIATPEEVSFVTSIFKTVGTVEIVKEEDMHAITALSGSGPAYIYYLVEAFEKAGFAVGLDPNVAKSLILQTMIGAAEMLKESTKHPSQLRKEVTSPNGTTQAGINVLESYKFEEAIISCIEAACQRSKDLDLKIKQL